MSARALAVIHGTTCRGCGLAFIGENRIRDHADHTWECTPALVRAGLAELAQRLREG